MPPLDQPISETRFLTDQPCPCSQRRATFASATRSPDERTFRSRTRHWLESPRDEKLSGNSTATPAAESRSNQTAKRLTIVPELLSRPPQPCRATTDRNGPAPSGRYRIPCSEVLPSAISTDSAASTTVETAMTAAPNRAMV